MRFVTLSFLSFLCDEYTIRKDKWSFVCFVVKGSKCSGAPFKYLCLRLSSATVVVWLCWKTGSDLLVEQVPQHTVSLGKDPARNNLWSIFWVILKWDAYVFCRFCWQCVSSVKHQMKVASPTQHCTFAYSTFL